jgi:arabinogalactan oligomer/maltooligosaccharide transport system substrate-binding protein
MKKALSVLVVFLMVLLAACGNSGSNSNTSQGTTTSNTSGGSQSSTNTGSGDSDAAADDELQPEPGAKLVVWESKEEKPFIEAVGKKFEELYGVPVVVEEVPGGDQGGRLATDGPAGLAADVLTMPHDHIGPAATAGLILPNDYFEEETRASSVESAIIASTYNGILYGYPKSVETYALFYNKDIIDTPPTTWDEVIEFAKGYNNVSNNQFAIMWEVGNAYFGYPFIASYGGYIFGNNGSDPNDIGVNADGAIKGFELFKKLKEILPLNTGDITWDVKTQLFLDGKLAINIDGPWAVANFRGQVNFGIAPLPAMEDGTPMISFSGVKSYYVNSYSKYPNAARLFAHFASSKENQLLNYEMTGIIPANKEAGEDPTIKNDPVIGGFFEQFVNSNPMPTIPEMQAVWDPVAGALATVWNEQADVKAILDTAAQTIREKIQSGK